MRLGGLVIVGSVLALLMAPGGVRAGESTGTGGDWSASQRSLTQSDIRRLQDAAYDVGREVSRLRARDARLADQLQDELDDLRDEITYLKVKLRRERTVARSEYTDVRDRLEALRSRAVDGDARRSMPPSGRQPELASGESVSGGSRPVAGRTTSQRGEIPVGQELDVRLLDSLSSGRNEVEDRFTATTLVDLQIDERVVIPAGSELRGVVSSVIRAGRLERTGKLTVSFDQITISGRTYPLRGTVTEALQSEGLRGEAAKIGTGAGVGAIIGGILGGFKGALAGILIGGGGVIAATEGKDVELPSGTVLRVRLDSPPEIR